MATVSLDDRSRQRYTVPLTGTPLRQAGAGDGAWRALGLAMAEGRTFPSLPAREDPGVTPTAALVARPAQALADLAPDGIGPERELGADQSHTSVVLGDALLLKAYRRLQPGLFVVAGDDQGDVGHAALPRRQSKP